MNLVDLIALFLYVSLALMLVPVTIGFLSSIWQWIQEEWDKSRPRPDWRMRSKRSPPQSNNAAAQSPNARSTSQQKASSPSPPSAQSAPGANWWWQNPQGGSPPTKSTQIHRAGPPSAKR